MELMRAINGILNHLKSTTDLAFSLQLCKNQSVMHKVNLIANYLSEI